MKKLIWPVLLTAVLLAGCATRIEKPPLKPEAPLAVVDRAALPAFSDDLDRVSLETAVGRSLQYFDRLPEGRLFRFGARSCTAAEMKESHKAFLAIVAGPEDWAIKANKIADQFDVYRSVGASGRGSVLFTGYYNPRLKASLVKTEEFRHPIYRAPEDLLFVHLGKFREKYKGERLVARLEGREIVPYHSREEIDTDGVLKGKGLEIAWLADPVDIFFLHIQGSGRICPPKGECFQVSYALSNGRPYRSIGKLLMDQGKIDPGGMSAPAIKQYLREHPEEMTDILNFNESYVFFRVVSGEPVGSLDVPVTAGRTIATDSSLFPRGALAYIKTRRPVVDASGQVISWKSFSRFVLNQDTGGAITGPGRVDLFCGSGPEAEEMAGYMKEEGELYFLVKKEK